MWAMWQAFPLSLHPMAFSIGFFSVSWYALCYLLGAIGVVTWLARDKKLERLLSSREHFWTLVNMVLWGVLLGARFGFVILYGDASYWEAPWRIVSPYDFSTGVWTGIRGLSFYGGLLGGGLALFLFARRAKLAWWSLTDAIVAALPLGLFFGRLGNFLNGELIGRVTTLPWGVHSVVGETMLRHPSQLYEALGEGLGLWLLFVFLTRYQWSPRFLSLFFLLCYGLMRFTLEFFREPDAGATLFFGVLTLNQLLALTLSFLALWLFQGLQRPWYNGKVEIPH